MSLLDMWFRMTLQGYAPEVTRDQLGKLGGNDRFIPPPPEFPPGKVDRNGVMVRPEGNKP